jgi:hypothetical protein
MSLEEQLLELLNKQVTLANIPEEEHLGRCLIVEQDYHYKVGWISFTSAEVVKVEGTTIHLYPNSLKRIQRTIDATAPHWYDED